MKLFANITKRDDEQRMVWGVASTEALDSQGEVVKLDAIKGAWDDYMKFANIREMHQPSAVGKCREFEFTDSEIRIGVHVVDDAAWAKVVNEVYTGFSIGGKALNKADGVITQLRLSEISLVDRPANPEALISVWKGEDIEDPKAELAKWAGEEIMDASTALQALGMIYGLMLGEMGEVDNEDPAQVAQLKAVVDNLKAFIAAEIVEDNTGKADKPEDVAKAGAKFSKATKDALAGIHADIQKCNDTLNKMGYDKADDEAKSDDAEDLSKIATEKDAAIADLAKMTADLDLAKSDLAKAESRIKELEAQPEPTKAPLNGTAVSKSDDTANQPESDPVMDELQKKADAGQLTAADVMKAIHSNGGRPLIPQ